MRKARIVKIGDFAIPDIIHALDELSSQGYCCFNFDSTHIAIPEPDYIINGITDEYSYDLLCFIVNNYKKSLQSSDDIVIGIINKRIEKNYFSFVSHKYRCAIISIADIEDVIKPFNIIQFLIGGIAENIVAISENHTWHSEPRRCLYDFCGDKRDIVSSLSYGGLCNSCKSSISEAAIGFLEHSNLVIKNENGAPIMQNNVTLNFGSGASFTGPLAVGQTISQTYNKIAGVEDSGLRKKLEEMVIQVGKLIEKLDSDESKTEVSEQLSTFVEQAKKEKPSKKLIEVTSDGMLEAAKTVASLAAPVTVAVKSVLDLLLITT